MQQSRYTRLAKRLLSLGAALPKADSWGSRSHVTAATTTIPVFDSPPQIFHRQELVRVKPIAVGAGTKERVPDVACASSLTSNPASTWHLRTSEHDLHGSSFSHCLSSGSLLRHRGRYLSTLASSYIPERANTHAQGKEERTCRTGVIAIKCGMTRLWEERTGHEVPVTVLWVDDNQVVQVKREESHGYWALQVGSGQKKAKQVTKPDRGHFQSAGVPIKRRLAEFRVTSDALLPVGASISAAHFVPGQFVDVAGTTAGKGFQGWMKRWGFRGNPASHGASLSHRSGGSTGGRQDPGKVFKGKKMPGQMGNKRRTVHNVCIVNVEPDRNLLYVRGQVPGHKGGHVFVKDAFWKPHKRVDVLGSAPAAS